MRFLFMGKIAYEKDFVLGSLVYSEQANSYYIVEHTPAELSWLVEEDSIEQLKFEVNTIYDKRSMEIITSNTFEDYKYAKDFYDSLGKDVLKELLLVDENGETIDELETNCGE